MIFRSKIDKFFLMVILIVIILIATVTFVPLLIEQNTDPLDSIIMVAIFSITVGFIMWIAFSIKYVFMKDHLFVGGGPFRSRIPYEEITKVNLTKDIFTGYRLLSSREALELHYKSAILGSVKISPKDEEKFIAELKKRSPNVIVQK